MFDEHQVQYRLVGSMPQAASWQIATYVMPSAMLSVRAERIQLKIGGYDYAGAENYISTKLTIGKIWVTKRPLFNVRVAE